MTLAVVKNNTETVGQRVARLQAEAKALAKQQSVDFMHSMAELAVMADEIAAGGDAYAPGVRDVARVLSEELAKKNQTLGAILSR